MESRPADIPIKQLKNDLKIIKQSFESPSQDSIPIFFMAFLNHINLWMEAQPSDDNWDFENTYEFVFNHLTIKYLNIIRQGALHMMALINIHETPLRHPLNNRYPLPESDYFSKIRSLCDIQIEQKTKEEDSNKERDKESTHNTLTIFLLHINDYLGYELTPEARIFLAYFSFPADQATLICYLPEYPYTLPSIYGVPEETIIHTIKVIRRHHKHCNETLSLEAHVLLAYFSFRPEHRASLNTLSNEIGKLSRDYPIRSSTFQVAKIIASIKDYTDEEFRKSCGELNINLRKHAKHLYLPQSLATRSRTSSLASSNDSFELIFSSSSSPQVSPTYSNSPNPGSTNSYNAFFPSPQPSPTYSSSSSPGSTNSIFDDFPLNDGFALPSPMGSEPSEEDDESKAPELSYP